MVLLLIVNHRILKDWIMNISIITIDFISGYYLFIEASFPRKRGDKAILTSPNIRSASKACLQFKAHMYGRGIGALKIETVKGSTRTTIFSKSGAQGNIWQSYNVDLPAGGPYKVLIYLFFPLLLLTWPKHCG